MEKEIESIAFINRYIVNNKDNFKKTELARGYLTSKVNSMLSSKLDSIKSEKNLVTKMLNIPLTILSI